MLFLSFSAFVSRNILQKTQFCEHSLLLSTTLSFRTVLLLC